MPVTSHCPICAGSKTHLFLDGDDSLDGASVGSSRIKISHGRILRCDSCGSAFRSLRPLAEELAYLYREADDSVYEREIANRFKNAQRHRRIAERFERGPGVLVDVGSASGAFLRVMADAGWDVTGVEPSRSQCARAARILDGKGRILETGLESAELPTEVDLVTLWDVLEHVTDPVPFLRLSAAPLKKTGHLILNVPRIDSWIARATGSKWPLLLAEHLNYFSYKGLRACAAQAGLEVLASGSRPVSFSLEYVLYRLSQHGFPGTKAASGALRSVGLGRAALPVWMGEMLAVCRRAAS